MNSIFPSTPKIVSTTGLKILFFHGLEGSATGQKATHLKKKWGAVCPPLRTSKIRDLSYAKGDQPWSSVGCEDITEALEETMSDAKDAISYLNPDVIIGSSMGGAVLMKLASEGIIRDNVTCVFLAPAISELASEIEEVPSLVGSSWLLGELDDVVDNVSNISDCYKCGGNLLVSPEDGHRLFSALKNGLIDASILTAIEFRDRLLNTL